MTVKNKNVKQDYKKSVAMFRIWERDLKKLEKEGYYGTDYYVRRVSELEEEVQTLKNKIKKMKKKNA